jgi:putative hydrolase of the HAD superfamily
MDWHDDIITKAYCRGSAGEYGYNCDMKFSTIFFDLDDTLYPNSTGLWEAIRVRMVTFLEERLGFNPDEVNIIRKTYFETYGTTLRGLQIHNQVDTDEYLAYVHDLPLEYYISPDPELVAIISSLPQKKWVFTNADSFHAQRVLSILGFGNCFQGIIDVRALGFLCKPEVEAYLRALALAGAGTADECVLLDDSSRNLNPAHQLGFTTVLVGSTEPDPSANHVIRTPKELPTVIPELWNYTD